MTGNEEHTQHELVDGLRVILPGVWASSMGIAGWLLYALPLIRGVRK